MRKKKGSKTGKRSSGNESVSTMKDLNCNGNEKEGTEMDAFTIETTIVKEDKAKPVTPVNSPSPTPPLSVVSESVDKIQEDIKEKELDIVAVNNEENSKVFALNKPELPPAAEDKEQPQITLRDNQWSPLNPGGKKKYDRDFLLNLRTKPVCTQKPDNLPEVIDKSFYIKRQNQNVGNPPPPNMGTIIPVTLDTKKKKKISGKKARKLVNSKKDSQVIQMSLNEDVKLKTTDNPWKSTRMMEADTCKSDNDKETEVAKLQLIAQF